MSTLRLDLVTPEKLIFSRDVDMAVIPGKSGYLGIMAEHAPMATSLKPGLIGIYEEGKLQDRLFIRGGFAEVSDDVCTILADEIKLYADINVDELKRTMAEYNSDKDERESPAAKELQVMIEALEGAETIFN